jgi:bacterioferritin-associated ferredoxin
MIIDQNRPAVGVIGGVPGEMDFLHCWRRQGIEIGHRVSPQIAAADVDVVHIAQQATACTPHQLSEKLGLGDDCMGKTEVTRGVLDEEATLQDFLGVRHMPGNDCQGLLCIG